MLEEKKSFFKNKEEQGEVLPKGFNQLHNIIFDTYCCLGVAACIVVPNEDIDSILIETINVNPFIDHITEEFSRRTNLYISDLNDGRCNSLKPISHKRIGEKLMKVFEKDLIY